MPLYEDPIQKCGSRHWLTAECPKGICDLLVFERDIPVYKPVVPPRTDVSSKPVVVIPSADTQPARIELAQVALEEGERKSALSAADKQKRYRARQKAKRDAAK